MSRPNLTTTLERSGVRRPSCPDPPREIDGWEPVQPVHEGPLTRTYRARPAGGSADRPAAYALKLLRRRWWGRAEAVGQLAREAFVGRTVAHRHLISVLASNVDRPPYYLVAPWIDGKTLAEILVREPALEVPTALWFARQAAEALDALDQAGWSHGDVKPGNLLVSPNGHITLLDLGFARQHDECDAAPTSSQPVMGTCRYLAPEMLTSAWSPGIQSDIYSLGVVLFEMLTGRPPFEAGSLADLARQHREARAPELRRLLPHAPGEVARLVAEMLAKQPLRRPRTPAELVRRLTALEIATFGQRLAG